MTRTFSANAVSARDDPRQKEDSPVAGAELAALEWQVLLWSGETTPEEHRAFDAWLAADPAHQAAFSKQYIFEPLGMNHTRIVDRYPSGLALLARGYERQDGHTRISESRWEQTGDGQVHASARDMLRWLRHLDENTFLTTPGGARTEGVLTLLTDDDVPVAGAATDSYHYGLEAISPRATSP